MRKNTILLVAAVLALPRITLKAAASEGPGRMGVHARLYEEAKSPDKLSQAMKQINTLAREIRAAVNKARPGLPISSYVWGYNTYTSKSEVCQDWLTWIDEGTLDWINPSGYRYTDATFLDAARLNREHVPKGFPFYITIGVKTSHGSLKNATEIRKQMTMARQCGADGLVFFTWEALRPFANEVAGDIKSDGRKK